MEQEQNKYYTPTIEEFHVGFEIECNVEKKWIPVSYMSNFKLSTGINKGLPTIFDTYNMLNCIRVKYLDKKDIESLGFKLSGGKLLRDIYDEFILTINNSGNDNKISLTNDYRDHWIAIAVGDDETCFPDWDTLFMGTIKNKSELKILLKWLKITD